MDYETKNLSTVFTYIFWLYRVPYLMFKITIIGYMDYGTKNLSTLFTYTGCLIKTGKKYLPCFASNYDSITIFRTSN